MNKLTLSVETDDALKMKTLVVLADIVINSETCNLEYFQIATEICFFADLFKMYLAGDESALGRSYHESEELIEMSRSLESIVTRMRSLAKEAQGERA